MTDNIANVISAISNMCIYTGLLAVNEQDTEKLPKYSCNINNKPLTCDMYFILLTRQLTGVINRRIADKALATVSKPQTHY